MFQGLVVQLFNRFVCNTKVIVDPSSNPKIVYEHFIAFNIKPKSKLQLKFNQMLLARRRLIILSNNVVIKCAMIGNKS